MSKLLHFRYLMWLALIWPGSICLAQSVTIRVIDVHNARPLQKQKVALTLLYDKGEKTPATYEPNLSGETDANGETQFRIPDPAPLHFSVMVHLTSEYLRCGCWVMGDTQDLIQKGFVGPQPSAKSHKSDPSVKAAPGEILILAGPMSFFEGLLYPLLKD
jgi:hypothetical protein